MPSSSSSSSCAKCSATPMLVILFLVSIEGTMHVNDSPPHHQILKADVGQDVTFSCHFDEEKLDQVSFMRQMTGDILSLGSELFVHEATASQRIQLTLFSSNRLDLKLISINQNDSGIYTCMVNDDKLTSFVLEIFVPPRFTVYSPLEASVSFAEGSPMTLFCRALAVPSANITWIYRDKTKQSKTIHVGEDLSMASVHSSQSGSYECIASNDYHASISRSFYVTVQYSPRVMIFNEKMTSDLHETVIVKCHVCSIPQIIQINWLRHEQIIMDVNVIIKSQPIDDDQCLESIMEIVDISEYQFGRYQCQAENVLGEHSAYVQIEPIMNIFQIKQPDFRPNEINRNGRTALLIDPHSDTNQSTSTSTVRSVREDRQWFTNGSEDLTLRRRLWNCLPVSSSILLLVWIRSG